MNIYYVYAYLRKSDLTPYYIGKGKGNRSHARHDNVTVPKDKSKIVFLEQNLTEVGSFALERRYINWYGRKDLGTGILLNKSDGGEGSSGFRHSEEHKQALREKYKGKPVAPRTPETFAKVAAKNRGRKYTKEELANRGPRKPLTEETKAKMKGRTPWNKGKTGIYSEATIQKIKEARAKQVITEETKEKKRGRTHSPETKAKMSETQRVRRLKEREAKARLN